MKENSITANEYLEYRRQVSLMQDYAEKPLRVAPNSNPNLRLQCLEIASKLKTVDGEAMALKELIGKAEALYEFINKK